MRGRLDSFGVAMGIFLPNSIPGNSIDKWAATFPAAVALPNSGPRGGTAQLGRERFHLFAYFLERARTVDALRSIAQLLFHRHLRRDAPSRFLCTEPAREQTRELLFGLAPGDYHAVEKLVIAGLDDQRRLDESCSERVPALPLRELALHLLEHSRMHNAVEPLEFSAIREHDRREIPAIDAAVRACDFRSKFAEDFVMRRLARLHQTMSQSIGVQHGKTEFAQHPRDGALPAGNSPGQAKSQHERRSAAGSSGTRGWLHRTPGRRSAAESRSLHRVAHQHRDGHRADAAGNRSQSARDVYGIGMHVAGKRRALGAEFFHALRKIAEKPLGLRSVGHAIRADINHGRAGTYP